MAKREQLGFWNGFNLAAAFLIVLFLIGLPLLFAFAQYLKTVDIRAVQYAPALIHATTTIDIVIDNTERTPLNAVEFELSYDPKAILITGIASHSTLCEERFTIANTYNNASGSALFQCGTVTPFSGAQGIVATIQAIPLVSGTSTVSFAELTHVLAHDGLGTDVTQERHDLIFTAL